MLTWNSEEKMFSDKLKLPSGQTVCIMFQQSWGKSVVYFSIGLEIYHKRKQVLNLYNKQTGKDGLTGLIWAKNKILEFEDYLKSEESRYSIYNYPMAIIYCTWTDNQRRRVYERGLSRIGFKIEYLDDGDRHPFKALVKRVKNTTTPRGECELPC